MTTGFYILEKNEARRSGPRESVKCENRHRLDTRIIPYFNSVESSNFRVYPKYLTVSPTR